MPAPSTAALAISHLHSSIFRPISAIASPLCVNISTHPGSWWGQRTCEPIVRFVSKLSPPESQYRKPLALNSRSELHLNPQLSTLNYLSPVCPVSGHPAASFCSRCRCPNRLKTNDFRPFSTCFIRAARTVLRTLENCSKIF